LPSEISASECFQIASGEELEYRCEQIPGSLRLEALIIERQCRSHASKHLFYDVMMSIAFGVRACSHRACVNAGTRSVEDVLVGCDHRFGALRSLNEGIEKLTGVVEVNPGPQTAR
jgi:hypothetical protein